MLYWFQLNPKVNCCINKNGVKDPSLDKRAQLNLICSNIILGELTEWSISWKTSIRSRTFFVRSTIIAQRLGTFFGLCAHNNESHFSKCLWIFNGDRLNNLLILLCHLMLLLCNVHLRYYNEHKPYLLLPPFWLRLKILKLLWLKCKWRSVFANNTTWFDDSKF